MTNDLSFEDAINQLENIVKTLEDGNVGLNDSIKLYEKGIILSDKCTQMLNDAKQKIEVIKNSNYKESEFDIPTEVKDEL